jgi:hypothetical protein
VQVEAFFLANHGREGKGVCPAVSHHGVKGPRGQEIKPGGGCVARGKQPMGRFAAWVGVCVRGEDTRGGVKQRRETGDELVSEEKKKKISNQQ